MGNQTATTIAIRHTIFDDDTSFQHQIDLFHHTDILISPHGGQLTGIPFMPDCGAVIEIFAKYYLPHFFGSLTTASQLSHGYIAMESEDPRIAMKDVAARQAIRNCPVSPPKQLVDDAIHHMIGQWQTCCRQKTKNPIRK
jgi:Glycosyltransferase 61